MLLPGASTTTSSGSPARLDRLERRVVGLRSAPAPAAAGGPDAGVPRQAARPSASQPGPRRRGGADARPAEARPEPRARSRRPRAPRLEPARAAAADAPAARGGRRPGGAGQLSLADVRRIWPDLLEQVKKMRRFTWILLSQNAQVIGVDATSLTVGFKTAGARDSFLGGGSEEILRQAAIDMIGADWKVETAVDPSAEPGSGTAPRVTRPAVQPAAAAGARRRPAPRRLGRPTRPPTGPPGGPGPAARPESIAAARVQIAAHPQRRGGDRRRRAGPDPDADAHRDDPASEDNGLDSTELLQRELGATVIEEIPHD